jgi:thiol-disulfide isomerase/thioredoxin
MTYAALLIALIATTPSADVASDASGAVAARGEPVLLNFTTTWCGYCRQMRPALDQLAGRGYPIKAIDGDKNQDLAQRYKVTGYPTFVVVDDEGNELARSAGLQPAAELASMYREAQGKVRSRPRTQTVADRRDDDETGDDSVDDVPSGRKNPNPNPWETVVRIRMRLSGNAEGVGSGTIISSNARETIILTCAHIFKEEGRPTPAPSQYRKPISVDLFDGQLGGRGNPNQVHYVETVKGEAIDYDLTNDVGLIRIRPGKVLPHAKVVPPTWKTAEGMSMTTVGCSEGKDATAWTTVILRTMAKLKNTGTGESFYVTECDHPPKQGRSGGGLFTDNGYVAGVCDFADPQHGHGLYAVPQSIYKILDRNRLAALYDPAARTREEPKRLLADRGTNPARPKSDGTYRSQSPDEGDLNVPPPSRFGIKPPVVAEGERPASKKSWEKPAAKLASRQPAEPDTEAVPSRMTRDDEEAEPAPAAPAAETNTEDVPAPKTPSASKWKPVRKP